MKKVQILVFLLNAFISASSQDFAQFQSKTYSVGADTLPYRILYPENYDSSKKYPLVVFLHGAGQRGNDNQKQLTHGASLFLKDANRAKFPAIVIFPQCSRNDFWARTRVLRAATDSSPFKFEYRTDVPMNTGLNLVSQLLDSFASTKIVDTKRIYLGGLSMGGMGTFELLWRKPGFFAAAFPICGGGNPLTAELYPKKFPIWVFHGDKDPTVDVNDSRNMVSALKATGVNAKYSEYPGVKHDSWRKAFQEPQLLLWLFGQKKG